jgi:O-methyltransferase
MSVTNRVRQAAGDTLKDGETSHRCATSPTVSAIESAPIQPTCGRTSFPPADLHFFSNIYHDWPPERGRVLTEKSFAALPAGGRIVIHELLYDDDKTGPVAAAAYSAAMLMRANGQPYSGAELTAMLTGAGFRDVEVRPTFGYDSVVTAVKP